MLAWHHENIIFFVLDKILYELQFKIAKIKIRKISKTKHCHSRIRITTKSVHDMKDDFAVNFAMRN